MKTGGNNKIKIGIGIVLVLIAAGGFYYYKKNQTPVTVYKDAKVGKGPMAISILSTGVVQPENRLEIKPPIAGRVERVLVNEGDRIRKGQVLAWMSSTERAALIDAASSKGAEEIARWEELYKPTPVLAPINGMLIARNIESGQTFAATDAILVMSDRLTVKAQVDETDIARIQLKQKADLVLDAYPGQTIPAHVDQIAFEAKTVNNVTTYLVDVLPEKTPDFMRSGMTANVTFQIEAKEDVLQIPADAVKIADGKSTVMVRDPQGEPVAKLVQTGLSDGRKIEIVDGLQEGDTILIPEFRLEGKKGANSPFGMKGPNNRRGK